MTSASDIAFTPAVKAEQERRGSRAGYAHLEKKGGWATTVTPELAAFLREVRSFYLGTASKDGQPYIQHRGGPKGFLHVLDERTLAFPDFAGNRQYITTGNLSENPRVILFLMDYANRRRVKIWGSAHVVGGDDALNAKLAPGSYPARVERAIVLRIEAWDANCPQHIPRMYFAEDVEQTVAALQSRIDLLEQDLAARAQPQSAPSAPTHGDPA